MTKLRSLTIITFAVMSLIIAGCNKSDNSNAAANNANKTTMNANTATNSAATPAANTSSTTVANSTPTEAYKSAYAARKNKDIPALKKLLSKDILDFFKMMGEADDKDKKSLDDMLKEMCDDPQGPSDDVRNEKIDGDKATLEYLEKGGEWRPMDLVKEDGGWKLTIAKGDKSDDKKAKK